MAEPGQEVRSELALAPPRGAGLAILRALARGPCTVGELVAATGLSQPNVSNHLARLRARRWVRSERQGRHICYSIAHPAVAQFLHALAGVREAVATEGSEQESLLVELEADYLAAVLAMSEDAAHAVIERGLAAGVSWDAIYLRVFRPVLERIGVLWEEQGLPVSVEHAATAITLRLMHRIQHLQIASRSGDAVHRPGSDPADRSRPRRRALVACVAGELHAVGARMVADFLAAADWEVTFLDANVPAPAIVEAAIRHLPHAVFLCATTAERAGAVADSVAALRAWRGDRPLPLLIGGGQFFLGTEAEGPLDLIGSDLPGTLREVEARLAARGVTP